MLTINTNVASLNAQRNLSSSQNTLQTTLQRLSSGLRINSAKDDAAGLAISERMSSQIRGMDQARRNANDGISMAQTAEGALASSGDVLQRIRELAVQSSNSTNTASDRQALQAEVGQLTSELDRISSTTQFNGQNLLDGTGGSQSFQVGANAGQTITTTAANFRTSNYGNNNLDVGARTVSGATNIVAGTVTINGALGSATYASSVGDTAKTVAAGINALSNQTGVQATAETNANLSGFAANQAYTLDITSDNATAVTVSFSMGAGTSTSSDLSGAINAINAATSKTGVTAQYDSALGGIKLTNSTGNDITVNNTSAAASTMNTASYAAGGTTLTPAFTTNGGTTAVVNGNVTLDSNSSFSVSSDTTGLKLNAGATTGASGLQSVASLDVTNFANSQKAIKIVDAALSAINGQRAQYGALQSRFQNTISNLQSSSENLSASRSRIQDADFASETATLTKSQVLQQAGTAMLAQANQLPQGVLSLLR